MSDFPLTDLFRRSKRGVFVEAWLVEMLSPPAAIWFNQVLWHAQHTDTVIKADGDWLAEIGMSRHQVQRAREKVVGRGWIECAVHKSHGVPTIHIELVPKAIEADLRAIHCSESSSPGLPETEQSTSLYSGVHTDPTAQQSLRATDDAFFAQFYEQYPRKVGKDAARRAWDKAVKRADPSLIIEGAAAYREDPVRLAADPRFTPYPASWLNAGRWEDELEPEYTASNPLVR